MESVKIKDKLLKIPIIQGGMGVGVSLSKLARSVMENNCMGVISAAQPGYRDENFLKDTDKVNYDSLVLEIKKAKENNDKGLLGVNIMVAMRDYDNMVKAAIDAGADVIISGAGIPLQLPSLTNDTDIALAPIVSSGKVAEMICKKWDRSYQCIPDLIIIEGPEAGGHLGFKLEQLSENIQLEDILKDVLEKIEPYELKYSRKIPVFVAGGIYDGNDIARMIKAGASGVQMGTRFIATEEADCHETFKQAIVNSNEEDIVIIKSPVGMPGRALLTPLIKKLQLDKIPIKYCYNCLIPCNPAETAYCISDALIASAKGNIEDGLFFCGSLAYKVNKIVPVKELINELVEQTNLALNNVEK